MRAIITTLLLILGLSYSAQTQDDMPMPDSGTVVAFPWCDNNQFLEDFLVERG